MLRSFDNQFLSSDFPSVLDADLIANNGYDNSCGLFFDRIPQATGYFTQLAGSTTAPLPDLDSFLDQHFCQEGDRAILRLGEYVNGAFHGPHFVLVTGKGSNDWDVFDPGWKNVSPSGASSSLQGHYTGFTTFTNDLTLCPSPQPPCVAKFRQFSLDEVRLFATSAIANSGSFSVNALSPVELLVVDSQGRRLGSQGGVDIFEIPKGSYFRDFPLSDDVGAGTGPGDPSGRKTAYIAFPQSGTYLVEAAGTALGTYMLDFRSVASDGSVQESILSGVTNVGATTTYRATYSPTPGSSLGLGRVSTFQTTLADINNSLQLGLIDNGGIANSLSQKIDAAQSAAGPARNNILNAFKKEVNAQTGKHITGIAPQVLLQDAASLISQNP
jgi:hypothetical protein